MSIYNIIFGNSDVYYPLQAENLFLTGLQTQIKIAPDETGNYVLLNFPSYNQLTRINFPDPGSGLVNVAYQNGASDFTNITLTDTTNQIICNGGVNTSTLNITTSNGQNTIYNIPPSTNANPNLAVEGNDVSFKRVEVTGINNQIKYKQTGTAGTVLNFPQTVLSSYQSYDIENKNANSMIPAISNTFISLNTGQLEAYVTGTLVITNVIGQTGTISNVQGYYMKICNYVMLTLSFTGTLCQMQQLPDVNNQYGIRFYIQGLNYYNTNFSHHNLNCILKATLSVPTGQYGDAPINIANTTASTPYYPQFTIAFGSQINNSTIDFNINIMYFING